MVLTKGGNDTGSINSQRLEADPESDYDAESNSEDVPPLRVRYKARNGTVLRLVGAADDFISPAWAHAQFKTLFASPSSNLAQLQVYASAMAEVVAGVEHWAGNGGFHPILRMVCPNSTETVNHGADGNALEYSTKRRDGDEGDRRRPYVGQGRRSRSRESTPNDDRSAADGSKRYASRCCCP